MKQEFNMDEALELIKQGTRIDGKDEVLVPLIKQLMPDKYLRVLKQFLLFKHFVEH